MWLTILAGVLQIVGWLLDRSNANEKVKELFYEFVRRTGSDLGSAKLLEWGDAQLKFLQETPFEETK